MALRALFCCGDARRWLYPVRLDWQYRGVIKARVYTPATRREMLGLVLSDEWTVTGSYQENHYCEYYIKVFNSKWYVAPW